MLGASILGDTHGFTSTASAALASRSSCGRILPQWRHQDVLRPVAVLESLILRLIMRHVARRMSCATALAGGFEAEDFWLTCTLASYLARIWRHFRQNGPFLSQLFAKTEKPLCVPVPFILARSLHFSPAKAARVPAGKYPGAGPRAAVMRGDIRMMHGGTKARESYGCGGTHRLSVYPQNSVRFVNEERVL
ncbi:hypothetical protein HNP71_001575 [Acidocella aromatica]|uniref:Uncharacterized protein n=1 Tax=Acidocella aromatica TaxID=1303579 RepID=A0A840VJG9_9PROT|nr:hypothetical protein [Acidocella aromatica]